jgi:hypothetical protein
MHQAKIRWGVTALALALFTGCGEPPGDLEGETASVAIRLEATSDEGVRYRLSNFDVDLVGPVAVTMRSEDFDETDPAMTAVLPSGVYSATVQPGWLLERFEGEMAIPVQASLLLPTVSFIVTPGQQARISFGFRTFNHFEMPGSVEVGFEVHDGVPDPWLSPISFSSTSVAITTDDMGNIFHLVRTGSALKVDSFTSWGAPRWTRPVSALGVLTESSSFDIEAIDQGRIRAAWDAEETLVQCTLDATTGEIESAMSRPFNSLGIPNTPFGFPKAEAVVAIGRLGSIALATMPSVQSSYFVYLTDGVTAGPPMNLGFQVSSNWTATIKLALSGLDENLLIAWPLNSNGNNYTVQYRTDTGGVIWSASSSAIAGLAADDFGNLFALRTFGTGTLSRWNPVNGVALWTVAVNVTGNTRFDVGGPGIVVSDVFGAVPQVRHFGIPGGALLSTTPITSMLTSDTLSGMSIDPSGGVALGIRRSANALVGRIAL